MDYPFRNLVFEGGGVKGIAYVGALEVLEAKGILQNIKRVGGTSAGAINAVLMGLNYTPGEMKQILSKLSFTKFLDDDWGLVRDSKRLINEFGWYKGDYFRNWVSDLIGKKTKNPNATFKDAFEQKKASGYLDMYFMGANLSTGFAEVFSYEHTPRMCIADAVRISMSLPLFFAAKRSPRGDVYVDGGLLDNYPIKLFDRDKYVMRFSVTPKYYFQHNKKLRKLRKALSPYVFNQETLGFRLESEKEIAVFRDQSEPEHHEIGDLFEYLWRLVTTLMRTQESQHLHSDDWQRTIYIDTLGVRTTDFNLNDRKKNDLLESGRVHTKKYFEWYDDARNQPANRPW